MDLFFCILEEMISVIRDEAWEHTASQNAENANATLEDLYLDYYNGEEKGD